MCAAVPSHRDKFGSVTFLQFVCRSLRGIEWIPIGASAREPGFTAQRPEGRESAVRDLNANELDALDRLIAVGPPSRGSPGDRSEIESLARVAFAFRDVDGDDAGLNAGRTWNRIAAGLQAPAPSPRSQAWWGGLGSLLGSGGARSRSGLSLASSMAALIALIVVAGLAVVVLPGG